MVAVLSHLFYENHNNYLKSVNILNGIIFNLIPLTLLPDINFRVMNMSNFNKHIYLSRSGEIEFLPESPIERFL